MAKATIPQIGSLVLGNTAKISLAAEASSYTHTLKYIFGAASGTIVENVKASYAWEVPLELANQIPNAASGTMTVICETYNVIGALIGTERVNITAEVPDDERTKPDVTMALRLISDLKDPFAGLYIEFLTQCGVEASASGKYGAGIAEYKISVGYQNPIYKSSAVVDVNTALRIYGVAVAVTDTRGFVTTVTQYPKVIGYVQPFVKPHDEEDAILCCRCDADGTINKKGTSLLIKVKSYCWTIKPSDTNLNNRCVLRYRYKAENAADYSEWVTLSEEEGNVSVVCGGVTLGIGAYKVHLQVEDAVGEIGECFALVHAATAQLHLGKGGRNVAIGQACDYSHEDALDIGYTAWFNKGVGKHVIFNNVELASGSTLREVAPDADISLVEHFTIFVGEVKGGSAMIFVKSESLASAGAYTLWSPEACLVCHNGDMQLGETEIVLKSLCALI